MTIKSISLSYEDVHSDKVYHMQIVTDAYEKTLYRVLTQWGPRGGTLQHGTKTPGDIGVPLYMAEKLFAKVVAEKIGKGYQCIGEGISAKNAPYDNDAFLTAAAKGYESLTLYPVELLTEIVDVEAYELIQDDRYVIQEKHDGHRRQVRKMSGGEVVSYNRKGQLVPLPDAVVAAVAELPCQTCMLDGELESDWFTAFDLLEMKPKLAPGSVVPTMAYIDRMGELWNLVNNTPMYGDGTAALRVITSRHGTDAKIAYSEELYARGAEGFVLKLAKAPYKPGRNGQHKKFKFTKTLSAVVHAVKVPDKQSAALVVYDDDGIHTTVYGIGSVSIIGKGPISVGDIVEVKYLYATKAHQLYQPVLIGKRDDLTVADCTLAQLQYKGAGAGEAGEA